MCRVFCTFANAIFCIVLIVWNCIVFAMRNKYIIVLLSVVFALSSCVTSRRVNYMQEPNRQIPTYGDTLSYEDYRLQKGDRLFIQVYSIDEKTALFYNSGMTNTRQIARSGNINSNIDLYTYIVDLNGNINFPTLGFLQVRGLTTREVKHLLEDELASMLRTHGDMPNISVEVQIVQRYFSVIGAQSSGRFAINKEKITIFEALAMAHDIAEFGDRSKVHIIRETEDSTIVKTFDVRSKDIINSEFYFIEPNDVIYVQKMKGQAFGINSAAAAVSVAATTISFGVFIYTLIDRFIIQPVLDSKKK